MYMGLLIILTLVLKAKLNEQLNYAYVWNPEAGSASTEAGSTGQWLQKLESKQILKLVKIWTQILI